MNKLGIIFREIDSSKDIKEHSLLRDALVNELNNINDIANEMSNEQARVF